MLAGNIDEQRHETVEPVDAGQHAHAGAVCQFVDLLAEAFEETAVDLEEIVARIGFERIEQHAARMTARVEAEMLDDARTLSRNSGISAAGMV